MLNKIFIVLLAIGIVGALGLTYLQYSWLQSLTKPTDVVTGYEFYNGIYWGFLWVSSLVLLVAGNIVLWKERKSWALWASLLYFIAFISVQMWWIGGLYFDYKKQNNLESGAFPLGGIFGVLICILAAVVVFFDQFLVLRTRDRIQGSSNLPVDSPLENERVLPESNNL